MTQRSPAQATVLIGVDDTDNVSSRGTGHLVQRLIVELEAAGVCVAIGATRHQLSDDPRIPSTSHNSSACIGVAMDDSTRRDRLIKLAGTFLETESAPGSDPGLVVADRATWSEPLDRDALVAFGRSAKTTVVDLDTARGLAGSCGVHASGHGGDSGGIIGALAAVGLHLSGSDGFFLWMPGIRELEGRMTYEQLRGRLPIDVALDPDGAEPASDDLIDLGDWVRPVWKDHRAVLLLWSASSADDLDGDSVGRDTGRRVWRVAPRYIVRDYGSALWSD
jgi:hypothetical protein